MLDDKSRDRALSPPLWPRGSVASLSAGQAGSVAEVRALAELTADFAYEQGRWGGPLKGAAGIGQQWITSGVRAGRADASAVYERACSELAIGSSGGAADGVGVESALQQLLACSTGTGTADSHGGYMSYAPTAALFEGALAAFACAAINPGLTWMPTSPKFAAMERCVLEWVATDVLRWPSGNAGIFTSGGSVANTLALHVARETVAKRAGVRPSEVVFFLPDHAHYCIPKGLRVLGVEPIQIVRVPCRSDGRTDSDALGKTLTGIGSRLKPGAGVVIGVGGETSTGSVDALDHLADLCAQHGNLWLHVDACFGGFFALTQRGAALLRGMDRANSVALDPHKALQAPYGVGMLVIRDEKDLRHAFTMSAAYTPPASIALAQHDIVDIADLGLELTREARGAQVWLPLRAHGPAAFALHLDWCQDAVTWLASMFRGEDDLLELVTAPQLSTLTFRVRRAYQGISAQELAVWLVDDVNARGRVLLAPTTTSSGVACVRICILSARSRPEHLSSLVEDVLAAAATVTRDAERLEQARANPARALGFRASYAVRPLPGKGLGVVAGEDIPAGSLVWEFEVGSCIPTTADDVLHMASEHGREATAAFLNHCFCWAGEMLYPQGDTKFFNHSKNPNICSPDGHRWLANRLIQAGEEMLDDYGTYDELDHYEQLCAEFGAESASSVAKRYLA